MTKLINLYRAMPSPTNRAKLQKYLDKHMMAICMASPDDVAFLKGNGFSI
jgi:predicted nucleotide-binding protein